MLQNTLFWGPDKRNLLSLLLSGDWFLSAASSLSAVYLVQHCFQPLPGTPHLLWDGHCALCWLACIWMVLVSERLTRKCADQGKEGRDVRDHDRRGQKFIPDMVSGIFKWWAILAGLFLFAFSDPGTQWKPDDCSWNQLISEQTVNILPRRKAYILANSTEFQVILFPSKCSF